MSLTGTAAVPGLHGPAQQQDPLRSAPVLPEALVQLTAFAALAAATLAFGISSNYLHAGAEYGWPAYPAAAIAAGWALYLAVFSIVTMRRSRPLLPAPTVGLLCGASLICLASLASTVWLAADRATVSVTVLSLFLLQLIMLAALGYLRRVPDRSSTSEPRAVPLLLALFGCALAVAAITAPGLAATTAGDFAVPHGEHSLPGMDHSELENMDHHGH